MLGKQCIRRRAAGPKRILITDVTQPVRGGAELTWLAQPPFVAKAPAVVLARQKRVVGIGVEHIDRMSAGGGARVTVQEIDDARAADAARHGVEPRLFGIAIKAATVHR